MSFLAAVSVLRGIRTIRSFGAHFASLKGVTPISSVTSTPMTAKPPSSSSTISGDPLIPVVLPSSAGVFPRRRTAFTPDHPPVPDRPLNLQPTLPITECQRHPGSGQDRLPERPQQRRIGDRVRRDNHIPRQA